MMNIKIIHNYIVDEVVNHSRGLYRINTFLLFSNEWTVVRIHRHQVAAHHLWSLVTGLESAVEIPREEILDPTATRCNFWLRLWQTSYMWDTFDWTFCTNLTIKLLVTFNWQKYIYNHIAKAYKCLILFFKSPKPKGFDNMGLKNASINYKRFYFSVIYIYITTTSNIDINFLWTQV